MQGGKNKQPLGYTIIEVLIVLAISSFMFLIAAGFINGKQESSSFTQGVNETASRLQDTLSQVTGGHYSDVLVSCPSPAGTGAPATQQGTDPDCVFLGKIVHFYSNGVFKPVQNYNVFSLAAARTATDNLPNAAVAAIPGLTTQSDTPQGLEVKSFAITPLSGPPETYPYNIGFAQSLCAADTQSPDSCKSGSQTVGLVYANVTALTRFNAGSESNITGRRILPAQSAVMCLSDGTRAAQIFIGGSNGSDPNNPNNNNQLSISVKQLGVTSCP